MTHRPTDGESGGRGEDAGDREGAASERTGTDGVALIGHRGCAGQYPENTVGAIERAAPRVDAVEIDVRRCASGELVVFHDAELDRLTGASGRVADADWNELRGLCVLDSGESIPRLREALAAVPAGLVVNVELKEPDTAGDALDAVREAGVDALFSSFLPSELARLRELDPETDRALLVAGGDAASAIEAATDLGCVAVHPPIDLATRPGFVEAAHAAGLSVNAWTATGREDAERLLAAGADGVIADRWDLLREAGSPSRS